MQIAVSAETLPGESRVAVSLDSVKRLVSMGHSVMIQQGAGVGSNITDSAFEEVGASIATDAKSLHEKADILLSVRGVSPENISTLRSNTIVLGLLDPFNSKLIDQYNAQKLTCFSLERIPRISRAQSMDVLSSQANLAGYKAVMLAANTYKGLFPMLMTAAGTVRAAKVLILGAGVAGLQAIATAKRLGAIVEAFDVRPAAREQVESLGASFVEVPVDETEEAETEGGYAKEMSAEYKKKQAELVHEHTIAADIVITTALIPGRPAPELVNESMVQGMKPGSVIVDMAAEMGGNCTLTQKDEIISAHNVDIVGYSNIPSMVAAEATNLFARNVVTFLDLLLDEESGEANINMEDEVIAKTLWCRDGQLIDQVS